MLADTLFGSVPEGLHWPNRNQSWCLACERLLLTINNKNKFIRRNQRGRTVNFCRVPITKYCDVPTAERLKRDDGMLSFCQIPKHKLNIIMIRKSRIHSKKKLLKKFKFKILWSKYWSSPLHLLAPGFSSFFQTDLRSGLTFSVWASQVGSSNVSYLMTYMGTSYSK